MTRKNQFIFKEETLNDVVQYCGSQEELIATFKTLQKALIEKAMDGELAHHLGYKKSERSDNFNSRNSFGQKTITTDTGEFEISTPRDRNASI